MLPCLHGCSTPLKLKGSTLLYFCLHACSAAPTFLHNSTSIHLQRGSGAPELHISIFPCLHDYHSRPAPRTSTSLRLHCASSTPSSSHPSMPPRHYACSAP